MERGGGDGDIYFKELAYMIMGLASPKSVGQARFKWELKLQAECKGWKRRQNFCVAVWRQKSFSGKP